MAVEALRHTGIRIQELTELSHHSLIRYTLPSTGETDRIQQSQPTAQHAAISVALQVIHFSTRCSDGVKCARAAPTRHRAPGARAGP